LRYAPRTELTHFLNGFDLIQVVAGHPAWALVTTFVDAPVALQVATLVRLERSMKMTEGGGVLGWWRALMTRLTHQLDQIALSQVDAVFVENQRMQTHVSKTAPESDVVFAPPGIDTESYMPSETPYSDRDYILSVGRFGDPRKNPELLFETYARMREMLGSACPSLKIAGRTSPSQKAWRIAENRGVRKHITFHRNVSEQKLVDLYREALLFILSSDEEGLGLVLLEAMSCGIPVVSTDCGGPSTAIHDGKTGKLAPVGDADALAASAAQLLRNPTQLKKMGKRARGWAVQNFSEKAASRRFLTKYGEMVQ